MAEMTTMDELIERKNRWAAEDVELTQLRAKTPASDGATHAEIGRRRAAWHAEKAEIGRLIRVVRAAVATVAE
jgi:hypothetical protein